MWPPVVITCAAVSVHGFRPLAKVVTVPLPVPGDGPLPTWFWMRLKLRDGSCRPSVGPSDTQFAAAYTALIR